MPPRVGDIYRANFVWRESTDPRPCVIVDIPAEGVVVVAPLSAQVEDYYRGPPDHFLIRVDDPDFDATGLPKTSFADASEMRDMDATDLLKRKGCLRGDLARRFFEWIGLRGPT
jgi:mRNA-degrading endonuclease toxin of MazEF toxin-antitoxin module